MTPLLKLELRRQWPMALRMAGLTMIVCAVFFAAGKRTAADMLVTVLGTGLGATLIVPIGISRDKMEGTLDFVCGLPVEARAIAASRFIAMVVLAAPWAVAAGVVSLALPAVAHVNSVAVVVLTWLAMLLLGACATAAFACFDLETLLGAPTVAVVIAFVLVPRAVRALFPGVTDQTALQFLQQPAAPVVIAVCLLAILGSVGTMAFEMATRGFASYRADAARR